MHTGSRICGSAVIALILLRLALGWHFLDAGMEKIRDPNFTSEPFLLQAVGPVAPLFHQQVPGFHRWREYLNTPRLDRPLSADERDQLAAWEADLAKRKAEAKKAGTPEPVELPPVAAYQPWGQEIVKDWSALLADFKAASQLDADQAEQADAVLRERTERLAQYFVEIEADITEYRNELYRLSQMQQSPAADELPYLDERILIKKGETGGMPHVWIADIQAFEEAYVNALNDLIPDTASGQQKESATAVLARWSWLDTINLIVTWLTFGVGVLLLAGLFTRLAALVGAGFLLSVLVTQPPWIPGAERLFFPYQFVEFTALILLIATAAGRYGGLDFFIHSLFAKSGNTK